MSKPAEKALLLLWLAVPPSLCEEWSEGESAALGTRWMRENLSLIHI